MGFFAPAFSSRSTLRETPKGGPFSHTRGSRSRALRPFLCAVYVSEQDGALRPVAGIDQCPQAEGAGGCRLSVHGSRPRKTGPGHPLRILRCRTHGVYFTVYPHGHTPYGRQRLTPADSKRGAGGTGSSGGGRWAGTVFEAALQAAAGESGVRDAGYEEGLTRPRRTTHRRRVDKAARLLGLSAELDERHAERVALALDLPGLDHTRARKQLAQVKSLSQRGTVIGSVLERMPVSGAFERRLLCAGCLAGLWGRPAMWDALTSRRVFPPCGTPGSFSPRSARLVSHENVTPPAHGPPRTVPSSPARRTGAAS